MLRPNTVETLSGKKRKRPAAAAFVEISTKTEQFISFPLVSLFLISKVLRLYFFYFSIIMKYYNIYIKLKKIFKYAPIK